MFDDFFDNIFTGIANVLFFISNAAIAISIITFIFMVIYFVLYSYTGLFSHSHNKYISNIKKLVWFIVGSLAIYIVLLLIGHAVMPNAYA